MIFQFLEDSHVICDNEFVFCEVAFKGEMEQQ